MPELPEAELIARALNRALRKKKITSVEVYAPKLRTPLVPLKTAGLVGRTFVGCRRRARYAVADLDDGRALTMHFGMSGVVRVEDAAKPRRKHEHVVMRLSDGRAFKFEDPRLSPVSRWADVRVGTALSVRQNEFLVVILARYTAEMKSFIDSNPGLQSRFNRYISATGGAAFGSISADDGNAIGIDFA